MGEMPELKVEEEAKNKKGDKGTDMQYSWPAAAAGTPKG